MIKFITNALKCVIEQNKAQNRLNTLIGQKKKTDYIKVKIPKTYVSMLETIAIYGVDDNRKLIKILDKVVRSN